MRVLGCLVLGVALCGNAMALEASAGADTVNSSQVGIDAKLNATNTILTTSINQILGCQKTGKLYEPTTGTCIDVDEPLAKKIAACTTNKQFYNQNTGACMASAPDLTSNLNTTNSTLSGVSALLNQVVACNVNKQFYNGAGGCSPAGNSFTFSTYSFNKGTKGASLGWHRFCMMSALYNGAPSGGTQNVWPSGAANASGQYQWFVDNKAAGQYWMPSIGVVCGD